MTSAPRIALIGCGKQKAAVTCPAKEMYRSALFRAALRYSVTTCDRFYILSAKHGLLEPDKVIEPYELGLVALKRGHREAWGRRVGAELDRAVPFPAERNAEIIFLAGEFYSAPIVMPNERELYWEEPLAGLGIGERIRWLKANSRIASAG